MKKFINILSFYLVLILGFIIPLNVSATVSNDIALADFSNVWFESDDEYDFNEKIAKDDEFINLVVQAAQKKEKKISLNGVHPGKNIKLYGVAGSENVLQSFYDGYSKAGTMKKLISPDYSILVLYFNEKEEYVDSLVFVKENLTNDKNKDKWIMLCSGSMIFNDTFVTEYYENDNLENYVKDLGLKNAKELKFVSGITYMPTSIYFVQENVEYFIPLEDYGNMKTSQVYRASDVVDKYLKPVLDFQNKKAEEYSKLDPKDIPNGASPIPDELPIITSVDLNAHIEVDADTNLKNKSDIWHIILISVVIVGLIAICLSIVYVRKKSR